MNDTKKIYCCECGAKVEARLTDGREIYPHRPDLASLPFWRCDVCRNYVGCRHKTHERTKPLGCIPNDAMRAARKRIHALIDPAWKTGKIGRDALYNRLSHVLGRRYHTAELRTPEEANRVFDAAQKILDARGCGRG